MLQDHSQTVEYSPLQIILREGELAPGLLLVKSGRVQIFRQDGSSEHLLGVATAGQFLGEMSLLLGTPVSASARAIEEVEVTLFSRALCEAQLQTAPQWLVLLARGLANRLDMMNRKMSAGNQTDVATTAHSGRPQDPGWEGR